MIGRPPHACADGLSTRMGVPKGQIFTLFKIVQKALGSSGGRAIKDKQLLRNARNAGTKSTRNSEFPDGGAGWRCCIDVWLDKLGVMRTFLHLKVHQCQCNQANSVLMVGTITLLKANELSVYGTHREPPPPKEVRHYSAFTAG